MSYSLGIVSLLAALISFLLTPVLRDALLRRGLVDRPDGDRKLHSDAVPRMGGISVLAAYFIACSALWLLPLAAAGPVRPALALKLAGCVLVLFLTGLTDDLLTLRPRQKLLGQFAGSAGAWLAGVRIENIGGLRVEEPVGFILTVAWLLVCTNSFNLIDGLDGLAAGIGLFATSAAFGSGLLQGNPELCLATAPLAGALIGFLRYNLNPASIFLGDCGSLSIGFLLGCFAVLWGQKSATLLGVTAPVITLAVPILDTALSIVRRFLRGQPVFTGDRGHIHHRLLDQGLTPRRALLVLYCFSGFAALISLLQTASVRTLAAPLTALFTLVTVASVRRLRYAEFSVARRVLASSRVRERIQTQISLLTLQSALASAAGPDECWEAVRDNCRRFGFDGVSLSVGGAEYHQTTPPEGRWSVRIPLSAGNDYVQLSQPFRQETPEALASLAEALQRGLTPRLEEFGSNTTHRAVCCGGSD